MKNKEMTVVKNMTEPRFESYNKLVPNFTR